MKGIAFGGWLAALICGTACGCVAQAPNEAQAPTAQPGDFQTLNQPVKSNMTCGEFEVDPVWWSPSGFQRRLHRCPRHVRHTHRNFAVKWSNWSAPAEIPPSLPGSSN